MTGWQPPEPVETGFSEYIGGEVVCMTAYEIIMIFLGIIGRYEYTLVVVTA